MDKSVIEMTNARVYFDSLGQKRLIGTIYKHPKLNVYEHSTIKTSPIIKEHSETLFETMNTIYKVIGWL